MAAIRRPSALRSCMPWFLPLISGLGMLAPASALTVRVDTASGVPRLLVNDVPARARMFWGAPGSAPLPALSEGRIVSFEFVANANAEAGTMHFRFGHLPGVLWLDDIKVRDLDAMDLPIISSDFEGGMGAFTRSWTSWPVGMENTVGSIDVVQGGGAHDSSSLRVQLKAPPSGKWPDFHIYHLPRLAIVEGHRYQVSLWVRAEPERNLEVAFYKPGQTYLRLGGPPGAFDAQIRLAANAGVDFVSFPIPMPWPKPGEPADWSGVDQVCGQVLRANPRALLLPRMGMDPPPWWKEAHPGDVMQWEDGRRDAAVVGSPEYRHAAVERLVALVNHLEESFGEHVAGYHPCGQNTGEWFYHETWGRTLSGYAPGDLAAWRKWLHNRYRSDEELRMSWNDPSITRDKAEVPRPEARHGAPAGVFRDPVQERPLIDWALFQQEMMADCVCELASAVRQATRGRKLVVFFYGYVFEFGAVGNGPSTSGHYALRRVLECPDIDVLCSPISYHDRGLGQGAPCMSAAESVALAGKLWINEDDTHTYLASGTPPGSMDHVTTIEETNQELLRNLAQEAMRNLGTWWMDLGATGWFNDPAMWAVMKRLQSVDETFLKAPVAYRPEVACLIDESSMLRLAAECTAVSRPAIYAARTALGRMGAPYGQYLLDDVLDGEVKAKLYVFLNAWCLEPNQRKKLLEKTQGAGALWCYAPGYMEDHSIVPAAMQELTGIRLEPVTPTSTLATPTELGRRLGLSLQLGSESVPRPLLAARDAKVEEVLAMYNDGSAAVVLRKHNQGVSLFVGSPGLTSELLRVAARASGVHLFSEQDCNVYANGRFVAVHASQDGDRTIIVPSKENVFDAWSAEVLGLGPRVTLPLRRGETRLLRY